MPLNLVADIPNRDERGNCRVVVETPRHSRVKLKYNEALGVFEWSRPLTLGVEFPYDFGFFPRTVADDGDALDALVYTAQASSTHPGVVVPCRVVGALRIEQQRGRQKPRRNDRIVVVPVFEKRGADLKDVRELSARVLSELEEFCRAAVVLTGKVIRLKGWAGADEAEAIVKTASEAYEKRA